jgi:hypothetical protein
MNRIDERSLDRERAPVYQGRQAGPVGVLDAVSKPHLTD